MVKFQVMEIFLENVEVFENLPAQTEILHAEIKKFLGCCPIW
jgi:hypothetical protein